ncbi:MazG nucleotide pyrophosphohydrolase domain-containing protein [Candidatus Frankia nodulisporulans]|uniref:MazG nucleotide pyrophosphohydrolase domain-containing protein n=1 Tax=Candidatus Frankia nodulisporulans TaxID=2060052 RepID=UPI0013D1D609|nr:MazG nucleotide pyrophosphohydrolase domain-containing protein [Candidatus Frankia nodulisporulans]
MSDPTDLVALAEQLGAALDNAFAGSDPRIRQTLALAEETGEFVQAARRYLGLARRTGDLDQVAAELADVVITAFVTARTFGIDLPAQITTKAGVIVTRGWRDTPTS